MGREILLNGLRRLFDDYGCPVGILGPNYVVDELGRRLSTSPQFFADEAEFFASCWPAEDEQPVVPQVEAPPAPAPRRKATVITIRSGLGFIR